MDGVGEVVAEAEGASLGALRGGLVGGRVVVRSGVWLTRKEPSSSLAKTRDALQRGYLSTFSTFLPLSKMMTISLGWMADEKMLSSCKWFVFFFLSPRLESKYP